MQRKFNGLYIQVCNYRAIFKIYCSHKYCQIHYAYVRQLEYFALENENEHEDIEFDKLLITDIFLNSPVCDRRNLSTEW